MYYLEDIIEKAATEEKFKQDIKESDLELFKSMHKQVTQKKLSLTDRQYDLVLIKIEDYRDFLLEGLDNLPASGLEVKHPIRSIDRSKWVRIIDNHIVVRFVFNKKFIHFLESLKKDFLIQDKRNNTKTYKFTDKSCYEIINHLKQFDFEIDPVLMSRYQKLKEFYQNPDQHIPGIYDWEIKNIPDAAKDMYYEKYGKPSWENIHIYLDRKGKCGLEHFDNYDLEFLPTALKKIINRSDNVVFFTEDEISVSDISRALHELNRINVTVVSNDAISIAGYSDNVEDLKKQEDLVMSDFYQTFKGKIGYHNARQLRWIDSTSEVALAVNHSTSRIAKNFANADLIIFYNTNQFPLAQWRMYE